LRRSYVTWQEGKNPFIVVEFLSPGTQKEDLGRCGGLKPLAPFGRTFSSDIHYKG